MIQYFNMKKKIKEKKWKRYNKKKLINKIINN